MRYRLCENNTGLDYDFDSALNSELPFDVDSNGTAQVLIYHTHTSESYMDEDVDYFTKAIIHARRIMIIM